MVARSVTDTGRTYGRFRDTMAFRRYSIAEKVHESSQLFGAGSIPVLERF